jgi:hypothetical protein
MLRWEIQDVRTKRAIAWGEAKSEKACKQAIDKTLKRDLSMLNPARLIFEIKSPEG